MSLESSNYLKTIGAEQLQPFIDYLRSSHMDVYQLLDQSALPSALEEAVTDSIIQERIEQFLDLISLKLSIAEQARMCLVVSQSNVRNLASHAEMEDLDNFQQRLIALVESSLSIAASTHFKLIDWLGSTWLVREKNYVDKPWYRLADAYIVSFFVELIRLSKSDKYWLPEGIQLQSDADRLIKSLFPDAKLRIYVEREYTGIRLPTDAGLFHDIKNEKNLGVISSSKEAFRKSLAKALKPYLKESRPTLKKAAMLCNISPKTLQRRLAAENTTYSELLNEVIFDAAIEQLRETNKPVTQVALELGFTQATHFTRFFKLRAGCTPSTFRNS